MDFENFENLEFDFLMIWCAICAVYIIVILAILSREKSALPGFIGVVLTVYLLAAAIYSLASLKEKPKVGTEILFENRIDTVEYTQEKVYLKYRDTLVNIEDIQNR